MVPFALRCSERGQVNGTTPGEKRGPPPHTTLLHMDIATAQEGKKGWREEEEGRGGYRRRKQTTSFNML